jgi:electron transfer flavoprotein alpha subunit/quercetin dioxygenase-like cupin family protein
MNTKRTILVWGDLRTRRHWRNSLKVLSKARALAADVQAGLSMVLIGSGKDLEPEKQFDLSACMDFNEAADQAATQGAEVVYCLEHENLAVPRTNVYSQVLADFVQEQQPWLILLPMNDFGRETAAVCAQQCNAGLIADCVELIDVEGEVAGRCPAWGGEIVADITLAPGWPMAFVTVSPHGVSLEAGEASDARRGVVQKILLDAIPPADGLELVTRQIEPLESRQLEMADKVIVGGAGVGDLRGFGLVRDLAVALGAEVGATRPPVMNRWASEDCLIGQTGKTVHPRLLISVGTSGAIQYTAGIVDAGTVVAINSDPSAPIFQRADIGLVGDAQTLVPLITQQAQQLSMRRLADAACSIDSEEGAGGPGFGALVTQLREARGWKMDELAEKTGQPIEFIKQVEDDQISPPVSFILGMAQAMQVDPSTFLRKEEQTAIRDRRAQAYYQRTQEYSYTTLTPGAENSHLRAFMVTIEAQRDHKPVAYKHDGEEFIYVMEGDLELTLGNETRIYKTGESVRFNSEVAHKLKSASNQATRCLVVLYTV